MDIWHIDCLCREHREQLKMKCDLSFCWNFILSFFRNHHHISHIFGNLHRIIRSCDLRTVGRFLRRLRSCWNTKHRFRNCERSCDIEGRGKVRISECDGWFRVFPRKYTPNDWVWMLGDMKNIPRIHSQRDTGNIQEDTSDMFGRLESKSNHLRTLCISICRRIVGSDRVSAHSTAKPKSTEKKGRRVPSEETFALYEYLCSCLSNQRFLS